MAFNGKYAYNWPPGGQNKKKAEHIENITDTWIL